MALSTSATTSATSSNSSRWAAARALSAVCQELVATLSAAADVAQVEACLSAALQLFYCCPPDQQQPNSNHQQQLQQHADELGGWGALRGIWFADQLFDTWASAVLAVAAGEWLPRLPPEQGPERDRLWQLIADTFMLCPAWHALSALLGHLSAVTPHSVSGGWSGSVTAIAADSAAQLLLQRFLLPGSTGLQQLLAACDGSAAPTDGSSASDHNHQQQHQQPWSEQRVQHAAGLLAALPDRLHVLQPAVPQLPPTVEVVSTLLQQCVHLIAAAITAAAAPTDADTKAAAGSLCWCRVVTPQALQLTATLMHKLVTRGHGSVVADVVLQLAGGSGGGSQQQQHYTAALQQVLLVLLCEQSGGAAVEKLLVRVLRSAVAPTPLQQQEQQGGALLQRLLCPLLAVSAQLRTTVLHKLLLARTLPAPALQLLLQLLSACRPSLLPGAAIALAQAWCDSSTVPVSQQAYMTAALVSCIQQLPREFLDPLSSAQAAAAAGDGDVGDSLLHQHHHQHHQQQQSFRLQPYSGVQPQQLSSLLTSIVQGVSTRLSSPSPAIRLQAMRVGRGFAEKLDPAKPMFEDAGPLQLMSEELWPGATVVAQQQQQDVGQQGQQGGGQQQQQQQGSVREQQGLNSSSTGSTTATPKALAHLVQATAEPDSDDEEDGSSTAVAATTPAAGDADLSETGSIADSEGSGGSLLAFDLQEDVSAEQWWGPDGLGPVDSKGLGLRAVAAALRKQDDTAGALEALTKVEVLVRAQPDELPVVAPELARALIHCKAPICAAGDVNTPQAPQQPSAAAAGSEPQQAHAPPRGLSSSAEVQRQRALVAVLALSPLTSGDTVIAELYSANLDQHQRVVILDGLAGAAAEMADPRKAPQLALSGPQTAPELLAPGAGGRGGGAVPAIEGGSARASLPTAQQAGSKTKGVADGTTSSSSGDSGAAKRATQAAPGLVEASSRVWGKVSLQKQAEAAAAPDGSGGRSRTFRNRFAPIALRWAVALLQQCDVKQQGVDLFGRDSLLLGRLLTVLGGFVEAAAKTPAAVPLCAGLLELLRSKEISAHNEAYVRRSALVAASQVVRHLPPARLAGAMVERQADPLDAALVERLQWLMSWAQGVAAGDSDQHCRMLAAGCVAWHVELAEGAMAVLEHLPEPEGPSLVTGGRGRAGLGKHELQVQLPTMDRLVLS